LLWFYLTSEVLGTKNKNNWLYFSPETSILEKLQNLDVNLTLSSIDYLNRLNSASQEQKIAGGKQDVILFSHILQYTTDDNLVLEELKRLLRPGGIILLQTVINWEMERTYENPQSSEDKDRLNQYFEPGVKRIYGCDFQKHLMRAGFDVEVINYSERLGEYANQYYQLGDGARELIFKCKKI